MTAKVTMIVTNGREVFLEYQGKSEADCIWQFEAEFDTEYDHEGFTYEFSKQASLEQEEAIMCKDKVAVRLGKAHSYAVLSTVTRPVNPADCRKKEAMVKDELYSIEILPIANWGVSNPPGTVLINRWEFDSILEAVNNIRSKDPYWAKLDH